MRIITSVQLSDNTTPDGNRIDRALSDAVARINKIEPGDMARRWLPQKLVTGYQPRLAGGLPCLPFLPELNDAATTLGGVAPAAGYSNPHRVKGCYISPQNDLNYAWTWSMAFDVPVWIVEATACLITETGFYVNDWTYGPVVWPAHKADGDPVDDMHVVVSVDDPFRPEDRGRNAVVVARHRFEAPAEYLCPQAPLAGWPDMQPNWPGGGRLQGVAIRTTDLAVPVHRDGRLRVALVLPRWVGAAGMPPWGLEPWIHAYYSLDLTWLEEVSE